MNVINKFFLAVALWPAKLYETWGIDTKHLRAILSTKLMMDDRRPNTLQATRAQTSEKEVSNATLGTMVMSFFMGLMYLLAFLFSSDLITQLTLYFGFFITFLCMTLVSDFTTVLIDVRDTNIILPKPVNDKTFLSARLLHIMIHLVKLVAPMCLPTVVFLAIKVSPIASLAYLLVTVFAILFCIFLINAVYILILRITTPSKFKNIISYIQIAFAILIYGSYQLFPRMMDDLSAEGFVMEPFAGLIAVPPYWFACAINSLLNWTASPMEILAAFFAFAVPIGSVYVVVKYLAPTFNQKLAMISGAGADLPNVKSSLAIQRNNGILDKIAGFLSRTTVEQTGFLFAWKMMARSRDFKVKVYPNIGYIIVMMVVFFVQNLNRGYGSGFKAGGFLPLSGVYICTVMLVMALISLAYSEKHQASWMFLLPAINQPGDIIVGAIKAVVIQFGAFFVLATLILGLYFNGLSFIPNIILACSNMLVIVFGISLIGSIKLPFSQPLTEASKGGRVMHGVFMFLLSGLAGILHYVIFKKMLVVIAAAVVSIALLLLLINQLKKTSWQRLLVGN